MLIRKIGAKMTVHSGICIIFLLLIGLNMYYIYNYVLLYHQEKQEQIDIQQMEYNAFPDILPGIYIPVNIEFAITDSEIDSISESISSNSNCNYKKSWKGDCILDIPDIGLQKIVYTGADRLEHLKQYELATATDNMEYKYGGNYIICGHASRLYGHSLNRIKEVQKGTIIYIKTPNQTDQYKVDNVRYENMHETSTYCNQTTDKRITIISCAKYISKDSYIVIQASPNDSCVQ